ncbi:MAG: hypothetical protein F6K09_19480, partial [Merismopedia sp. SIO2A8]|nr:hypothetical protein [Merismopedia sp. SIO2A8]
SCPSVIISSGQTVTLSQMAFDSDTTADTDVYPVTGCLTNHTDKAIISAAINYLGQPENLSTEQGEGQGQLRFDTIAPKSTVLFTVQFPVAEETDVIEVVSIAWRVEGASAEVLPLEFSLPLPQN